MERTGLWVQPAHTITLLCCVTIVNLLPYDLHYTVCSKTLVSSSCNGVIKPGGQDPVREVDVDGSIEFSFHLDNFPGAATLYLPSQPNSSFTQRLRLHDLTSRRLFLQATVNVNKGAAIKVKMGTVFPHNILPIKYLNFKRVNYISGGSVGSILDCKQNRVTSCVPPRGCSRRNCWTVC